MDIGVPFKTLGKVEVGPLVEHVRALPAEAWAANPFRQEVLADSAHSATRTILMRHEWDRYSNPWGKVEINELVEQWAARTGRDPAPFQPIDKEETDVGPVYTFADWRVHGPAIQPVIDQILAILGYPRPVVTRLALVSLAGGGRIAPHVDGQPMAHRAHRVHVPLSNSEGVTYKVDGRKFRMHKGFAYDFNNRRRHSVRNVTARPRVNLFVDIYPASGVHVPPPFGYYSAGALNGG